MSSTDAPNWLQIIQDIEKAGLSGAKIAKRIDVPASTLNALKNGATKEPRYSVGARLIALHTRFQGVMD